MEFTKKFGSRLFHGQPQKAPEAVDFDFSFGDFEAGSVSKVPKQLDFLVLSNFKKFTEEFELHSKFEIERLDYFVTIGLGVAKTFRRLPSALVSDQVSSVASTTQKTVIIVALPVMAWAL